MSIDLVLRSAPAAEKASNGPAVQAADETALPSASSAAVTGAASTLPSPDFADTLLAVMGEPVDDAAASADEPSADEGRAAADLADTVALLSGLQVPLPVPQLLPPVALDERSGLLRPLPAAAAVASPQRTEVPLQAAAMPAAPLLSDNGSSATESGSPSSTALSAQRAAAPGGGFAAATVDESARETARAESATGTGIPGLQPRASAGGNADAPTSVLKLTDPSPEQWRRPLQEALGDRLSWQVNRGAENAVIRLEPPAMGRIDILIRHENGALQVNLSASNSEVLRQLHHVGDSLRQDLAQRQTGEVTVTVGEGGRGAPGRERPRGEALPDDAGPGRALSDGDGEQAASSFQLSQE